MSTLVSVTYKLVHLSQQGKVLVFLLLAFFLYLPLTFLGYGTDFDSYQVIDAGKALITDHRYVPSRFPGYPIHEIPTAILDHIGGSWLANLGTLAMSLCAIYNFAMILRYHDIPYQSALVLLLITNPAYWVSSTSTIDYVWAIALMLIGYRQFLARQYAWAGFLLGLAAGTRLSSIIFLIALLVSAYVDNRANTTTLLFSGLIAGVIAFVLYIPTYLRLGLLKLYFGDWSWIDYLINFIHGNLLLMGQQTYLAVLCLLGLIIRDVKRFRGCKCNSLLLLCALVITGYEILFLKIPLEAEYLLPVLPFLLIVLGMSVKDRKWVVDLWFFLQLSSNFVSLGIVNVTGNTNVAVGFDRSLLGVWLGVIGKATSMKIGIFWGQGYLITDIINRLSHTLNG